MDQLLLNFMGTEEKRNRYGYIVNDDGRECTVCGIFKSWHFFGKSKNQKNGYNYLCKDCSKKRQKELYLERRNCPERLERFNNIVREYKFGDVREDGMVFFSYCVTFSEKNNFGKWISKENYENKVEIRKAGDIRRREEYNKVKRVLKRGKIRDDGKIFFGYSQTYASTGFEKWMDKHEFEISLFNECSANYLLKSLSDYGGKDERTMEIIGLPNDEFIDYIESLFEDGMNWSNRGMWKGEWDPENPKWHLDHIIPLSSVDNLEDTKHLWHYTNLRPMWGIENLSKGKKHLEEERDAFLAKRKAAK